MDKLEKVIKGIQCCKPTWFDACKCNSQCPYDSYGHNPGGCFDRLCEDALSLLKAQEPRVMTLEEVVEHAKLPQLECSEKAPVYMQYYMERPTYVKWVTAESLNIWLNDDRKYYNRANVFGWRCWTSRPTDEQREAAPWRD